MRLAEAKNMVLGLMLAGQPEAARSLMVSSVSPDADPGKFLIAGKAARAINRCNGWKCRSAWAGLSAAKPYVEYSFATGDMVGVMFENHLPDRTVEVEVEGELRSASGSTRPSNTAPWRRPTPGTRC